MTYTTTIFYGIVIAESHVSMYQRFRLAYNLEFEDFTENPLQTIGFKHIGIFNLPNFYPPLDVEKWGFGVLRKSYQFTRENTVSEHMVAHDIHNSEITELQRIYKALELKDRIKFTPTWHTFFEVHDDSGNM